MIIYFVIYIGILILFDVMGATILVGFVIFFPLFWFMTAQAAKRCHDVGRSGWYQLIPLYNLIILFQEADPGMNEYGHNPKTHPHNLLDSETLDGHLRKHDNL